MHHGSIAVESRRGIGSRFVVELPRDPREVVEVEPPLADEPPGTASWAPPAAPIQGKVDDSSPIAPPPLNPDGAP